MKTPTLIVIVGLAIVNISFAVDPPPDGGYPNSTTAEGQDALLSLTTGGGNTAMGYQALYNDTKGAGNTAVGNGALFSSVDAIVNTAIGEFAMYNNTSGFDNIAVGYQALFSNTTGSLNTAIGVQALEFAGTAAQYNVAIGPFAAQFNAGSLNIAVGGLALYGYGSDSAANYNVAVGIGALADNTRGTNNVAMGYHAMLFNATGNSNIALGTQAGYNLTTGDNNIDISNLGTAGEANTIRIGTEGTQTATYIAGIRPTGLTQGAALGVGITADGQLGVRASSARFKEAIKPMNKASEAILSLQPVTFRYKKELDPKATPQFGLVAEEVEKVDPDLVAKDDQGKPFTVRYEEVNAMLLNEFLKEHKKVENQAAEIAQLKSALKEVNARLDAKGL